MFAGHFGLAAAVKAKQPMIPLWALMLSTQLLDVIFVPLFITGIETMEIIGEGFGEALIHADFTHSLFGALFISILAGLLAWKRWGKQGGIVISLLVFSHWILDLFVHRADMPILPGNFGDLPLLGLGLWKWTAWSISIEALILLVGAILYFRSVIIRTKQAKVDIKKALLAGSVMTGLLALSLISDLIIHR